MRTQDEIIQMFNAPLIKEALGVENRDQLCSPAHLNNLILSPHGVDVQLRRFVRASFINGALNRGTARGLAVISHRGVVVADVPPVHDNAPVGDDGQPSRGAPV
jgi:hypothetical protein